MTNHSSASGALKACHCCGLIQSVVPMVDERSSVQCCRCSSVLTASKSHALSQSRTAAAAVAAMVLFPAAIFLPILEIEKLGHHHSSSIAGGIAELFEHESYLIGSVIFLFSIVLPLVKLIALVELCSLHWLQKHHRVWAYRMMEIVGKWSMMDVMLLALMVMLIKLSGLVEFQFGPAVIAFTLCVAMSLIASMSFDPHSIWESEPLQQ